jgi:hypothetical protein
VFEYFHNSIFDANTTQNNAEGQPRGKHNTHQFGGSIGGPCGATRIFCFSVSKDSARSIRFR